MIRNKTVLLMALMVAVALTACSKGSGGGKANPESDFEVRNIDGDKAVEITNYIGVTQNVNIPSKIRGLPVTHIGDEAFAGKNLTSITIPKSVTTIGTDNSRYADGAFAVNPLISITIGANVQMNDFPFGYNFGKHGNQTILLHSAFEEFYDENGKQAGTYTRPDADSEVWTKQ